MFSLFIKFTKCYTIQVLIGIEFIVCNEPAISLLCPFHPQWSWGVLAWELSTLAQPPYRDLDMSHLAEYLRGGYRLSQPPTCPDVLYQLMAFCWAINPQHRPRAALLVEYLLGLNQNQQILTNNVGLSTMTSTLLQESLSSAAASISCNHIPASSFLYNSVSVGTDFKRLHHGSPASLMNTSTSVGGDIKGLTHQFHSHSFNPTSRTSTSSPASVLASKPCDLKGVSQLAPLYSKPSSVTDSGELVTVTEDFEAVTTAAVYCTPTTLPGRVDQLYLQQVPWRLPPNPRLLPPHGAISVPPPLPPANGSLPTTRGARPQQPLPNSNNTIVL